MSKSPLAGWGILGSLCLFICASEPLDAGEIQGRVIDRGTLGADGRAKGIPGVTVTVQEGRKSVGSTVTNAKGEYRLKKVPALSRVVYKAKGGQPASLTRVYAVNPSDTGAFDVAFDRPPKEALEYWRNVASAFIRMPVQGSFFREASDTAFTMGGAFIAGDSSGDYRGAVASLLWAEFLSQERPITARYHLAHALKGKLDSLGWEVPPGMDRYLETDPIALESYLADLRSAFKDPKKLPNQKEVRKAGVPPDLAAQLAVRNLQTAGLNKRKRDQFKARWKKVWGRDLPEVEEEELEPFNPALLVERMADGKPGSFAANFLKGRALYAAKRYGPAAEALERANKLKPGVFPAARYLEAMALMHQGRDSEALGRFQALREAPDPAWKAKAWYGLGVISLKEKRPAEAASDLLRSVRLVPDPETIFLLAEVSSKLNDNTETEKLLQAMVVKRPGEHRAHYWLGRYAEKREQVGVAEDHFRKAWEASPSAEYAEALGRLFATREEWAAALGVLEPIKAKLSPEGRERYADCLMHAGRSRDAVREYSAAFLARPTPALLGRHVDALLQSGKADEAQAAIGGFADQGHPAVKLAQAKVSLRLGENQKARLLLEDLVKREETNPELHFLLGLGWYNERAYGKARREFDLALKYRADYLEAVYYSGLVLVKSGRYEEARNFFNELAQRTSPEWRAKGFTGVGLSFAAQQKPEAAENYYQRSVTAMETAEALGLMALSKRRLGGPEHWEADARRAFELDNRHPKAVLALGEVYFHKGKASVALKLFQKANELTPGSCDILAGLARSQYLMGQYQASRGTSAQAISQCPGEADPLFIAAAASDKLRNKKEAEDYFRAYRKAGGDEDKLPEEYR